MVCCRKGSMADSFLRMVTGWAMRYSKRSPSSRPTAAASMEPGGTLTESMARWPEIAPIIAFAIGAGEAMARPIAIPFPDPPTAPPAAAVCSSNAPAWTTACAGADELAAAMRSLDGTPYRGFALLYAAQKADKLVAEDPNKALALARLLSDEAESLPPANSIERISAPAPRQAVQAEAALLESQARLQKGEAAEAREGLAAGRALVHGARAL